MERVYDVTKECFNALVQIRNLGDQALVAPEMFHQRLVSFIDDLFRKGQAAGLRDRDVQDISYAIVALADEIAMRKPGGIRDVWLSQPLQLHYFNENLAGEGFFYRLEQILADPSRAEALRVFYWCLMFGFQGKFAMRGGELELAAVTRRVQDALGQVMRPEPLSKRHMRPRERVTRRAQGYLTVWIGLFLVLFSLALIIVLRLALDKQTTSLIKDLGALETVLDEDNTKEDE